MCHVFGWIQIGPQMFQRQATIEQRPWKRRQKITFFVQWCNFPYNKFTEKVLYYPMEKRIIQTKWLKTRTKETILATLEKKIVLKLPMGFDVKYCAESKNHLLNF